MCPARHNRLALRALPHRQREVVDRDKGPAQAQDILVTIVSMAGSVLHLKLRHSLAQTDALAGRALIAVVGGFALPNRMQALVPVLEPLDNVQTQVAQFLQYLRFSGHPSLRFLFSQLDNHPRTQSHPGLRRHSLASRIPPTDGITQAAGQINPSSPSSTSLPRLVSGR